MRALFLIFLVGCGSSISGPWTGDCTFEDLVGSDGLFLDLVYRMDLQMEQVGASSFEGTGELFYTLNGVEQQSGLSLTGALNGSEVAMDVSFDEELNAMIMVGDRVDSDTIEGDCSAGVAEGTFLLVR